MKLSISLLVLLQLWNLALSAPTTPMPGALEPRNDFPSAYEQYFDAASDEEILGTET